MKVWVLFFDDVAIAHYQKFEDLERDKYSLEKNLKNNCPVISYKQMTMGLY